MLLKKRRTFFIKYYTNHYIINITMAYWLKTIHINTLIELINSQYYARQDFLHVLFLWQPWLFMTCVHCTVQSMSLSFYHFIILSNKILTPEVVEFRKLVEGDGSFQSGDAEKKISRKGKKVPEQAGCPKREEGFQVY